MKFDETKFIANSNLPMIKHEDLHPLWIADYCDGPLSGAIIYRDSLCWYILAEEESEPYDEGWYRRYWLLELSENQRENESKWYELFNAHVGTHWNFVSDIESTQVHPISNHHLFYEPYSQRSPLNLKENIVIGWFQFDSNSSISESKQT